MLKRLIANDAGLTMILSTANDRKLGQTSISKNRSVLVPLTAKAMEWVFPNFFISWYRWKILICIVDTGIILN